MKKLIKKNEIKKGKYFVYPQEIVSVYTERIEKLGDPEPREVNLAYAIFGKMWKDEGGKKFLMHLISAFFTPSSCGIWDKVIDDGKICVITGKKIAGILPLSKALVDAVPISYTAKKLLGELTPEEEEEKQQRIKDLPEEYRSQRIGYASRNSDKTLSCAAYVALQIFAIDNYCDEIESARQRRIKEKSKNQSHLPATSSSLVDNMSAQTKEKLEKLKEKMER